MGPKDACLGRDTWSATVAPETTISSASTGDAVGPATTRVRSIKPGRAVGAHHFVHCSSAHSPNASIFS